MALQENEKSTLVQNKDPVSAPRKKFIIITVVSVGFALLVVASATAYFCLSGCHTFKSDGTKAVSDAWAWWDRSSFRSASTSASTPNPPNILGGYATVSEQVNIPGLVTGGSTALLIYPSNSACGLGGCPLISFAHGTDIPPSDYTRLLGTVASQGFVVVAIESCPRGECPGSGSPRGEWEDQLTAIDACKNGYVTNSAGQPVPALQGASFTKVGVLGHSMGGGATICSASVGAATHNVAAAVALHPSGDSYCPKPDSDVQVPTLFVGGEHDRITPTASVVYPEYEKATGPKAFINIRGATHTEPMDNYGGGKPYLEGPWAARWFECTLKSDSSACAQYFGASGASMCGAHPSPPIVATPCVGHEACKTQCFVHL